jgi:hypothetical protein
MPLGVDSSLSVVAFSIFFGSTAFAAGVMAFSNTSQSSTPQHC